MLPDSKPKLLIIEEDLGLLTQLRWHLDQYEVLSANSREKAIEEVRRHEPPLVLLDLDMRAETSSDDHAGLRCIRDISELIPSAKIMVIALRMDTQINVQLIEMGVHDIFQKPVVAEMLDVVLQRAFFLSMVEKEKRLKAQLTESKLPSVITEEPELIRLTQTIREQVEKRLPIALCGDVGTGKHHISKALHAWLFKKTDAQLQAFDCSKQGAALMSLLASKAPTDNHTLFIEHVEHLTKAQQAALTEAIQQESTKPAAESWSKLGRTVYIFARTAPLQSLNKHGELNRGLYDLLLHHEVKLPKLKDRQGDKLLLARHLLTRFRRLNPRVTGLHTSAIEAIEAYSWPANIKELERAIKHGLNTTHDRWLTAEDMGLPYKKSPELNLRKVRENAERAAITRGLNAAAGNVSKTAKLLGVTRPTLYDLIKKYSIPIPTARDIRRSGKSR